MIAKYVFGRMSCSTKRRAYESDQDKWILKREVCVFERRKRNGSSEGSIYVGSASASFVLLLLSYSPSAPHYYCPSMSLGGVLASPAAYIPYRPSILNVGTRRTCTTHLHSCKVIWGRILEILELAAANLGLCLPGKTHNDVACFDEGAAVWVWKIPQVMSNPLAVQ